MMDKINCGLLYKYIYMHCVRLVEHNEEIQYFNIVLQRQHVMVIFSIRKILVGFVKKKSSFI